MDNRFHSRASQAAPQMPDSPSSVGYPTNGSSTGGTLATIIGDYWYHAVTQEILTVIKDAELVPDGRDLTQLNKAIDVKLKRVKDAADTALQGLDDKIASIQKSAVPTGLVAPFAKEMSDPFWLKCDGSPVSRKEYADLFALLGETYGAGDGWSTFNLPDLRDRFVQGTDRGIHAGKRIEAGLPNIEGFANLGEREVEGLKATGAFYFAGSGMLGLRANADHDNAGFYLDASRSNAIYGKSATVQPPAVKMIYYIHI